MHILEREKTRQDKTIYIRQCLSHLHEAAVQYSTVKCIAVQYSTEHWDPIGPTGQAHTEELAMEAENGVIISIVGAVGWQTVNSIFSVGDIFYSLTNIGCTTCSNYYSLESFCYWAMFPWLINWSAAATKQDTKGNRVAECYGYSLDQHWLPRIPTCDPSRNQPWPWCWMLLNCGLTLNFKLK
jgi:hypothetical protein